MSSKNQSSSRKAEKTAEKKKKDTKKFSVISFFVQSVLGLCALIVTGIIAGVALIGIAYAVGYANLPDIQISKLTEYQPKLPLRVYTADGVLIGEYSEERRKFVPIEKIPKVMIDALLAVEDANFYKHPGVDPKGVLRAFVAKLQGSRKQGASTITMQLARNFFLSNEQTYSRKFNEMLIALEIERQMTKDEILEVYMNQIFLGANAHGFGEAAQTYFGKDLQDITLGEAAILAGLPQTPGRKNPIKDMKGTKERQLHVLDRMLAVGYITQEQHDQALREPIVLKEPTPPELKLHAEYAADLAQQMISKEFGVDAYINGLNVYTTILSSDQKAAYRAVRNGVMVYERRQRYRGPLGQLPLPQNAEQWQKIFEQYPDNEELKTAVILTVEPKKVTLTCDGKNTLEITGNGLEPVRSGLAANANAEVKLKPGSVVRILQAEKDEWFITQDPQVESALISMDTNTGAIRAMVGGFDFTKNKFNHAVQAWRQPGSSFKPFIYSAALEKGLTPITELADAAIEVPNPSGGRTWTPKNYGGKFSNSMVPVYKAVALSMNIPAILVIDAITPEYAQQWISRFGFSAEKNLPYLTMVLGAGSVTPLQMTDAYAVFANGGYRVEPYLIARITDAQGHLVYDYPAAPPQESQRVISARNAFVMSSLLRQVITSGTGTRAQRMLGRNDLYGKSGTTNNSFDVWFAGYTPSIAAIAWVGYDTPKELGRNEQGGRLALPIWVDYMKAALEGVPQQPIKRVPGVTQVGGQWVYDEFARGGGISSIGKELIYSDTVPDIEPQEKDNILDMFR